MVLADWDARLLSPEDGLKLAGDWPVYASLEIAELSQFGDQADRAQTNLRCRRCGQSCGLLGDTVNYETTIGDLLSGVLRHMVTAHDLSLAGTGHFCVACRAVLVDGHQQDPTYHYQGCELVHG